MPSHTIMRRYFLCINIILGDTLPVKEATAKDHGETIKEW